MSQIVLNKDAIEFFEKNGPIGKLQQTERNNSMYIDLFEKVYTEWPDFFRMNKSGLNLLKRLYSAPSMFHTKKIVGTHLFSNSSYSDGFKVYNLYIKLEKGVKEIRNFKKNTDETYTMYDAWKVKQDYESYDYNLTKEDIENYIKQIHVRIIEYFDSLINSNELFYKNNTFFNNEFVIVLGDFKQKYDTDSDLFIDILISKIKEYPQSKRYRDLNGRLKTLLKKPKGSITKQEFYKIIYDRYIVKIEELLLDIDPSKLCENFTKSMK